MFLFLYTWQRKQELFCSLFLRALRFRMRVSLPVACSSIRHCDVVVISFRDFRYIRLRNFQQMNELQLSKNQGYLLQVDFEGPVRLNCLTFSVSFVLISVFCIFVILIYYHFFQNHFTDPISSESRQKVPDSKDKINLVK